MMQRKQLHWLGPILTVICLVGFMNGVAIGQNGVIAPPSIDCAPRLDDIATNLRPLLGWTNSVEGGEGPRTYTVQLDTNPSFNSHDLIEYSAIEEGVYTSRVRVNVELKDNTQYFWRVKCIDNLGNESPWATESGGITARFFVNTSWNDRLTYQRVRCTEITASSGSGVDKIQDYDESGLSHWEGGPGLTEHWIVFDLGKSVRISRIWLLTGAAGWADTSATGAWGLENVSIDGRLTDYNWQYSLNGASWKDVPGTQTIGTDSYKAIFQLRKKGIRARFFRLNITGWIGDIPTVHEVTFYKRSKPPVPEVPAGDYVMVVDNGQKIEDNYNTSFRAVILGQRGHIAPPWDLEVVEVHHAHINPWVIEQLDPKPIAIFLTGQGRWWEMMPMFEFNGEMNIIRKSKIPVLGACGAHQLMAAQDGRTFPQNTGRYHGAYWVEALVENDIGPIDILEGFEDHPLFAGMNNPFYGPEFHSWNVYVIPEGFELLATSTDSKGHVVTEVIVAKDRLVVGTQFHAEVATPWSLSKAFLMNFLRMAVERAEDDDDDDDDDDE